VQSQLCALFQLLSTFQQKRCHRPVSTKGKIQAIGGTTSPLSTRLLRLELKARSRADMLATVADRAAGAETGPSKI
jgi:hypothetical protein